MPFAKKYYRVMGFPKEGDILKGFEVLMINITHTNLKSGIYEYPTEIIVEGKGGKTKVREVFKKYFNQRITTFSGYGNPYQMHGGRIEIIALGKQKYKINAIGIGIRIYLRRELDQFFEFLVENNNSAKDFNTTIREKIIDDYLRMYQKIST
ncbi:MAG: hypothetical protein ACW98D_12985 [Promethearchaeota archaeon]|jgi:hypothetical protein